MAHKDTIISYLTENKGTYCDDCLSKICNISPRQTVLQVCTKLHLDEKVIRKIGTCSYCGREKKVSSLVLNNKNYRNTDTIEKVKVNKVKSATIKENKSIYNESNKFIKIGVNFVSFHIKDAFSRFNAHTLAEILMKDKYRKLKDECYRYYDQYMNRKLGEFLSKLKQQSNLFYKKFLNPYGDELYCKFKMENNPFEKCKGLYMYKHEENIKYIGRVKDNYNFYQRINAGYANISPKNC